MTGYTKVPTALTPRLEREARVARCAAWRLRSRSSSSMLPWLELALRELVLMIGVLHASDKLLASSTKVHLFMSIE